MQQNPAPCLDPLLRLGGLAYQPNWMERCRGEGEFNQELYSVEQDPEENSNLVLGEGLQQVVEELSSRLREGWRAASK